MSRPLGSVGIPKYRKHKPSGRAVVTINHRDFYLGPYGTKASKEEYDRLVGGYMTSGRSLGEGKDFAVVEVIEAFWKHVQEKYANAGGSDGEIASYKLALATVRRLFGRTDAKDFGPLAMMTVRGEMARAGWCRTYINSQVGRVRRMFKWAVSVEMVPAATWHALQAVDGLRYGAKGVKESDPVRPVPDESIAAVLPHVAPQVAAMIQVQNLTGMRPGEVCIMRGRDLDTRGDQWVYRPARHKTQSRGHDRSIYLGQRCRAIIEPFLKADVEAYLFSPAEAEEWFRQKRQAARKTPSSCGNRPGTHRVKNPKRRPRTKYSVISYGQAIKRACARAFLLPPELARQRITVGTKSRWESESQWRARLGDSSWSKVLHWRRDHSWHPHQLRHAAATRFRKEYGIEAAQTLLGHRTLVATQVYAEQNQQTAKDVMAKVG